MEFRSNSRPANEAFIGEMINCKACPAREESIQVVPPVGDWESKIMIVGRNPGEEEETQGLPFVGPGGKLLDKMLAGAGLARHQVWITNLVKCHTYSDREPSPIEVQVCFSRHLHAEFEMIQPKFVILLGNQAIRMVAGDNMPSVTKTHGTIFTHENLNCDVYLQHHPGYLLRKPLVGKKVLEEDMPRLKLALEERGLLSVPS